MDITATIDNPQINVSLEQNSIEVFFPWTQWVPWISANERSEEPSWVINWINTYFTLPDTPTLNTEKVHLNWLRLKRNTDYTITSNVISIIIPPIPWDIIIVDYNI